MIYLQPMTQDDYDEYMLKLIPEFASELQKTNEFSKEEAIIKTNEMLAEMLPQGLKTSNHHLFNVIEQENKKKVGIFYVAIQNKDNQKIAFIYDIEIIEKHRGKGFGSKTMQMAEDFARERGAKEIWLHVFATNTSAYKLYLKLGYEIKREFLAEDKKKVLSRRMAKSL